jgi:hypothetical protein
VGTPVGKVRQISRLLIIFYKSRTLYFSRYFDQMAVRWIFFNSHGCFSFVFPFIYWGWRKKNVFCFHCVLEVKMGFLTVFPALSLDKAEWLRVGGDWKGNGWGFWCEGLYISSHYDSTENIQCAVLAHWIFPVGRYVHNWLERSITQVHNSRKIFIGRLKLPMELWCGSDGAAFASKLAVCPSHPHHPWRGKSRPMTKIALA